MSVLEIYINWVNSVLGEAGGHVDGVEAVQDGKVLCDLIDVLAPDAGLLAKVKASGECTPLAYIKAALDHMRSHGIKIKFPAEDIVHNEIKSMLDILWVLILNYGIHFIGQNSFQRSVGIGKKQLLEWCQEELGTTFDHRNTLTFNLCNGNWFVNLLERVAGCSMQKSKDTAEYIDALLTEIQDRYCIMKDIIKASDIVDGTVDEHTLMIYLSLLRRRASSSERHKAREMLSTDGKAAAMAKIHFFEKRARSLSNDSQRSRSADSGSEPRVSRGRSLSSGGPAAGGRASSELTWPPSPSQRARARSLFEQTGGGGDGNETSDWSSTGSLFSGREARASPKERAADDGGEVGGGSGGQGEEQLQRAISERVTEVTERRSSLDELVASAEERLGKEAESQRVSEKETDTLSDFSSSSLSRDRVGDRVSGVPVSSAAPPLATPPSQDRVRRPRAAEDGSGDDTPPPPRGGSSSGVAGSGSGPGAAGRGGDYRAAPQGHQRRHDHGSERRNGRGSERRTDVTRAGEESSARISPLLTPEVGGRHTSTPVPRSEGPAPAPAREESVTIRIKRPRDYIHQWEDTIDRLSGVSVTDQMGSPRAPLISSYKPTVTSGVPRSRSYDTGAAAPPHSTELASSSYSRRDLDLQRRSKSSTAAPAASVPSTSNGYHSTTTLTSSAAHGNGSSTLASIRHAPPVSQNGAELLRQDPGLTSILDRLPPDMRQQARDASKFLMQATGPEVLALMDAIKQARSATSAQETTPSFQQKYQTSASDGGEQTILKRRDLAPSPSSHSSGARVRFQPQSRSTPAHPRIQLNGSVSTAPLPPTSPRVQSTSPRRRAAAHAADGSAQPPEEGAERGSHRMLSISPHAQQQQRSRSLSPRLVREATASTTNGAGGGAGKPSSPRDAGSVRSLSLREDLLLKNLGMHSRVIEDERPSARLMALTSSPRVGDSTIDSPGRLNPVSPRRTVERLPIDRLYPEVTRLDLGPDSDRSFVSHDDHGGNEDGAVTPPPLRRGGGGGGGAGRMPRREAWELQRRRKGDLRTSASTAGAATGVSGEREDFTTPEGQSRFIEVLCKEIDALKAKVDSMEEDGGRHSVGRAASRSPSVGASAPNPRLLASSLDIRDKNDRMVFQPQRYASSSYAQSISPRRERATSCPLLETSSRSPVLTRTRYSPRTSASQPRRQVTPSGVHRPVAVRPLSVDTSGPSLHSRTSPGGIVLGYSSPARSVTPEIWGHDLSSPSQGFEPDRQHTWKRLITTRHLNEQQTMELKQALACALVENDILTAKLNNARHEIHDKLQHTNGVLDDCRRHLAKSQAENQELRTMLEQERAKSEGFEARIREMESSMNEVKVGKQQVESELNEANSRLNRSVNETKPGVEALRLDNSRLVSRLAAVENENDSLREDVQKLKGSQHKAMLTMDELRECLSKVRRDRQELFDELSFVQRREQNARVRHIMDTYQEKGAMDECEREPGGARGFPALNTSTRNASFFESDDSYDVDDDDDEGLDRRRKSRGAFGKRSVSPPPLRRSLSQGRLFSGADDLSPTRGDREIYPHRKAYTPRSRSISPVRSPRYFGSGAGGGSSSSRGGAAGTTGGGVEHSLIDQTLQEIERDMQRERETILSAADTALRHRRSSSFASEGGGLDGKSNNYTSTASASSSPSFRLKKKQAQQRPLSGGGRGSSPLSFISRRPSSPGFHSSRERQHSPVGDPIYPRSHHSRENSAEGCPTGVVPAAGLNASFSSMDELRRGGNRSVSPRLGSGSASARPARDASRGSFGGQQSTPGSPARSPRYFPRTAHSPPTRLPPDDKKQTAGLVSAGGKGGGSSRIETGGSGGKALRPLHAKSGKGEIARSLQREFDKEDKLLNSLANSSICQNKSWFEMQSESDGDDTGINSSMSSRSSCERSSHTGRKKTPFLSDEQRRYADELIQKYTGNGPH